MLNLYVAYSCKHVYAACQCSMSITNVHAACQCSMSITNVCKFILHILASCPCSISWCMSLYVLMLHFHAACPCSMPWQWKQQSDCGEPGISHDSHHVSLVQWTTCLLLATRDTGSNPLGGLCFPPQGTQVQIPSGDLCETGILLLALSRYIGDPDVIRSPALSPSRCFTRLHADNV